MHINPTYNWYDQVLSSYYNFIKIGNYSFESKFIKITDLYSIIKEDTEQFLRGRCRRGPYYSNIPEGFVDGIDVVYHLFNKELKRREELEESEFILTLEASGKECTSLYFKKAKPAIDIFNAAMEAKRMSVMLLYQDKDLLLAYPMGG